MERHLQKRRNVYYARLAIPADLRKHYNRTEIIQTLKTSDLRVAKAKVLKVISDCKLQFEALRGTPDAIEALAADLRLEDDHRQTDPNAPMSDKDSAIEYYADLVPPDREQQFRNIAMGRATPFALYFDEYCKQWDAKPKTKDMAKTAIRHVAEAIPFIESVTRPLVARLISTDPNRPSTKSKNYGFVRQYWKYLQNIGAVPATDRNPFSEIPLGSKKTAGAIKRASFAPREIKVLIRRATEKGDYQLADLISIAAYTGARIEEICQIKMEAIVEIDGTPCFSINDAKTEAGNRHVPIHREIEALVKRLSKNTVDGFLITQLSNNKYGSRSDAIGKRFGQLKAELGFGPEKVFHSIRKTVTTILENAGVPEGVAADIVGHEKATITYGLYSSGASIELKYDALQKITYPEDWI